MPYCRICGTQLEENAHFCHRCGAPVANFTPAPPLARSTGKNQFLVPVIILIAVLVVAVIVGVFIFWTFYNSFNQSRGASQTNGQQLSFNFHDDIAKANSIAQNLICKTVLINTTQ
ncbi:MAG TPA: zinc-ribbon domain-containing protein [Verrucomicrobiae bacterium]|nr:zinc-ribbon domain-containing protein [Verrucomicrobiae bacterium]